MMQYRLNANTDSYNRGGFHRFGRQSPSRQTETVRLEGDCRLGVWAFILSKVRNSLCFCLPFYQSLKFILPFFLLLFYSIAMQAQDKEKYLYKDSSVLFPQDNDADTVANALDSSVDEEQSIVADTILVNNGLYIPKDSVIAIKKEKSFAYATILDSLLKDMQQKQDVNYAANTNRLSALDRFFSARITKMIFWTIAALILGFIIIKLFFTEGFFQRKSAGNKVKELESEEDTAPDSRDYNRLINTAIEKKDFRLATRYLYLQSLYRLIALGAVRFATDKTNHQYLAELAAKPYQQAFAALTIQYEYAWYGGFTIGENRFASIQQSFTNFNNQLPLLH
jgi:hypothetical protein